MEWIRLCGRIKDRECVTNAVAEFSAAPRIPAPVLEFALQQGLANGDSALQHQWWKRRMRSTERHRRSRGNRPSMSSYIPRMLGYSPRKARQRIRYGDRRISLLTRSFVRDGAGASVRNRIIDFFGNDLIVTEIARPPLTAGSDREEQREQYEICQLQNTLQHTSR